MNMVGKLEVGKSIIRGNSKVRKSKYRISRRLGINLWGRSKDPVNTKNYFPGQHGQSTVRRLSNYSVQLRAKQQMRMYYNISEAQFCKLCAKAKQRKGDTSENLVGLLESRLDAIVFRSGFVATIFAARQLVSHSNVTVNNRIIDIRSFSVKPGDVVSLTEKAKKFSFILDCIAKSERKIPNYLKVDSATFEIEFLHVPTLSEIPYESTMKPRLVIEYYSK